MAKTSFQMNYAARVWPVVERWAVENNYKLETPGESTRLYLRKSEDSSTRISVAISQADADVQINAWFSDSIRAELEIDSPSLYSAVPRKEALSEIQKLLAKLGYIPADKAKITDKKNLAFNLGRSIRKLSGKK